MATELEFYCSSECGQRPADADAWLAGTEEVAGSWMEWRQARRGTKVKAPKKLGDEGFVPLDPAPGLYVREQA